MYIVRHVIIKNTGHWSYRYCSAYTVKAWHLYNAALFRIRQCFTGLDKDCRTANEQEVFNEIAVLETAYPSVHVRKVISYKHLEKLMRVTGNPDFFAGLPMQTAQTVVKQAVQDFKNWLASVRAYKRDPSAFLGCPRMPRYKKSPCGFSITNQDAVLYGTDLKLPCVKDRLDVGEVPDGALKEVKVIPYYGRYILSMTFECNDAGKSACGANTAGIDFGTDNIAAIVATDGSSRIYKGGAVLSENRYFAKQRAAYTGIITKGHEHVYASSKRLDDLSYHHANFNKDQLHKISRDIITFCMEHGAGTLVLGDNKLWKQRSSMGSANNQKFVQMPIFKLKQMLMYKAAQMGITVVCQEESYTSKASFVDGDDIPVYGVNDADASFSGRRVCRGLYRTGSGMLINADLNGAANIIRKAIPHAWNGFDSMSDYKFLAEPEVSGFHELNPQGIPVKRIAAA